MGGRVALALVAVLVTAALPASAQLPRKWTRAQVQSGGAGSSNASSDLRSGASSGLRSGASSSAGSGGRLIASSGPAPASDSASVSGPVVVSVKTQLPTGGPDPAAAPLLAIQPGQPLAAHDVRRTIERLFRTGRYANIVARSEDVRGGVAVVFELTPKQHIVQLAVDGAHVLTEPEVLEAAKLADGDEYYPERMDVAQAGILQAYHRRGYDQTKVQVEVSEAPNGVDVLFEIEEGPPTVVRAVVVAGNPGLPLGRITSALGLELGATLDLKTMTQGLDRLRTLYRQERFWRARVSEPVVDRKGTVAQVLLPVAAGPQYTLHFHHNRAFPDAVLRGVVHYDGSEQLGPAVVGRLTRRVEAFYRQQGFHDAHVRAEEVRSPDGSKAILSFSVDEGFPIYVERLEFSGNSRISTEELENVVVGYLKQRTTAPEGVVMADDPLDTNGRTAHHGSAPAPVEDPRNVLLEDAYREAAAGMTALYHDRGYRQAHVEFSGAEIDVRTHRAVARFITFEGPQAIVRELSFRGFPAGFEPRSAAELRPGVPLADATVEAARARVARTLGRKGYLFAKVDAGSRVFDDGRSAAVELVADPGPQVRVGQVIIQGLTRTDERMVRAYLKVRTGQVLDPDDLFETQRSLVVLGIFRQVAVKLIAPETPEPQKDVVVELRERPRLSGEIAGGYYLVDGPRVIFDATYPNLGGQGINLSGRLKVNYAGAGAPVLLGNSKAAQQYFPTEDLQGLNGIGGRGNITLAQPRLYNLLPLEIGVRMDLVGERTFRPAYTFSRFAAIPGADWAVTRWLNLNLQYELEYDDVRTRPGLDTLDPNLTLTATDVQRLRFPVGQFAVQSIRPTVTVDLRDDAANPTSGVLVTLTGEYSRDLSTHLWGQQNSQDPNSPLVPLCEDPQDPTQTVPAQSASSGCGNLNNKQFPVDMLKVSGAVTMYFPITHRVVFAVSGRGGRIWSFSSNPNILGPKRFFLGGSNSFRGFRDDALTPQDSREDLHAQVQACRSLVSSFGCTNAARALIAGTEIPSEGGTVFALGKAELRFPFFSSLELGLFGEMGNLWLDPNAFDLRVMRYVAGAGVRLGTPIGPLAFDLGFNLAPDYVINEQALNFNFSIGLF